MMILPLRLAALTIVSIVVVAVVVDLWTVACKAAGTVSRPEYGGRLGGNGRYRATIHRRRRRGRHHLDRQRGGGATARAAATTRGG